MCDKESVAPALAGDFAKIASTNENVRIGQKFILGAVASSSYIARQLPTKDIKGVTALSSKQSVALVVGRLGARTQGKTPMLF